MDQTGLKSRVFIGIGMVLAALSFSGWAQAECSNREIKIKKMVSDGGVLGGDVDSALKQSMERAKQFACTEAYQEAQSQMPACDPGCNDQGLTLRSCESSAKKSDSGSIEDKSDWMEVCMSKNSQMIDCGMGVSKKECCEAISSRPEFGSFAVAAAKAVAVVERKCK